MPLSDPSRRPAPSVSVLRLEGLPPDVTFELEQADPDPRVTAAQAAGAVVQSSIFRIATPPAVYVEAALNALREACEGLGIARASLVFVEAVGESRGVGYAGFYSDSAGFKDAIFIVTDRTPFGAIRSTVRHEAYHLAYFAEHGDAGGGHAGPSEDGAVAFENA